MKGKLEGDRLRQLRLLLKQRCPTELQPELQMWDTCDFQGHRPATLSLDEALIFRSNRILY